MSGAGGSTYYMLMASLPPLPALFTSHQTPISRRRLDRRLGMLEPEDRTELAAIEAVMWWDRMPLDRTDEEIVARANEVFPQIRSAILRDVAVYRLEQRTIVAALRRRAARKPAPGPHEVWGYGRWVRHIVRNWSVADFGLGEALPWVTALKRLFDETDSLGFERQLLTLSWNYMSRAAPVHFFTFEAVALYVLKWDILARWTEYDGDHARERFDQLVTNGLGDAVDLFPSAAGISRAASARLER